METLPRDREMMDASHESFLAVGGVVEFDEKSL
jgi:hypothetical protein